MKRPMITFYYDNQTGRMIETKYHAGWLIGPPEMRLSTIEDAQRILADLQTMYGTSENYLARYLRETAPKGQVS